MKKLFYSLLLLSLTTMSSCMTNYDNYVPFIVIAFALAIIIGLIAVFSQDRETSDKAAAFAMVMLGIFLVLILLG